MQTKNIVMGGSAFRSAFLTALFGLVLLAVVLASPAQAQSTLVVDNDDQAGGVAGCGADASYDTIQGAVDAAASGATINVCPGTYGENVEIITPNLTITGVGDELPVIDGAGGPHAVTIGTEDADNAADGLTLSNFVAQNSGNSGVWTDYVVNNVTISNVAAINNGDGSDSDGQDGFEVDTNAVIDSWTFTGISADGNVRTGLAFQGVATNVSVQSFDGTGSDATASSGNAASDAAPTQMPDTGGPSLLLPAAGLLALGLGVSGLVWFNSRRTSQNNL